MDISTQRQSLLALWKESFSVVNRSAFRLVAVVVLLAVLASVMTAAFALAVWPLVAKGAWVGVVAISVLLCAVSFFASFFLVVVFWRVLAATAEKSLASLFEIMISSIRPTFYAVITQILWMLVCLLLGFAMGFIDNQMVQAVVNLVFFLAVGIRMLYLFPAVAVRGQGPISAFAYTWKLTGRNYIDTLLMVLLNALFPLTAMLFLAVCGYALYVGIPLFFAQSFDITHLTWPWFAVLGVIVCVLLFIGMAMFAFPLLVFLNRDNTSGPFSNEIPVCKDKDLRPLSTQAPVAKKPQPEPLVIDRAPAPDLGPEVINLSEPEQQEEPIVDLMQSTFRTETTPEQQQEQLQEVYTAPKQEDEIIEYGEEERMPTIVFDEQMTRQLEENRKFWQNEQTQNNSNNKPSEPNEGSIRMSK